MVTAIEPQVADTAKYSTKEAYEALERTDKIRRAADGEGPHGQAEKVLYGQGDKSLVENLIKVRR